MRLFAPTSERADFGAKPEGGRSEVFASTQVPAIRADGNTRDGACRDRMASEAAGSRRGRERFERRPVHRKAHTTWN
jgi:hypothetical protein